VLLRIVGLGVHFVTDPVSWFDLIVTAIGASYVYPHQDS
jgi:hypothetical protein